MFLSIVIPTLNEEKTLGKTLLHLQELKSLGVEIIVVDGGSDDETLVIAKQYADEVVVSKRGRAVQLNKGAEVAQGDALLFLHADTLLSKCAVIFLKKHPPVPELYWSRFNVRLDSSQPVFRLIETLMNWRSCLTCMVTGDHAMLVSTSLFQRVGGYPDIQLMEDIAISKKLKQHAALTCLKETVITSARRWHQHGVVKTIVLMWRLRLQYFFRANPAKLAQQYKPK